MEKILITGANSYIGEKIRTYLRSWPDEYQVETIDMIDGAWKEKKFCEYQTIIHVAGIAHQRETKNNKDLYYKVNRDLAIATAKKAKEEGVQLFIFFSSMSVYGLEEGSINKNTIPKPNTYYGDSKLQAEKGILELESEEFLIAIIRPPMIYGEGCKGNYNQLVKLTNILPVFPDVRNKRSMLHIDGLCDSVHSIIRERKTGIFFPQDKEYTCTSRMIKDIAIRYNKKIYLTKILNPLILVARMVPGRIGSLTRKAFGSLVYEMSEEEKE